MNLWYFLGRIDKDMQTIFSCDFSVMRGGGIGEFTLLLGCGLKAPMLNIMSYGKVLYLLFVYQAKI